MIAAKVLCDELFVDINSDDYSPADQVDPNIPIESIEWAKQQKPSHFRRLVLKGGVFTPHETARMVHLMFTLNIMATFIGDFFNRNDKAKEYLDEFAQSFPIKDAVVKDLDNAAKFLMSMKFPASSYWMNKANVFSLMIVALNHPTQIASLGSKAARARLESFERDLPRAYADSAREAVNNKKERLLRNQFLKDLLTQ